MRTNKFNILRYLSVTGLILLLVMIVTSCNENVSDPALNNSGQVSLSKIVHRVSVGGCDITPPGQDRNFSLVAKINSNGEVSGQWQDGFGGGHGSIHVAVDCLTMVGDNAAIVGGVITHGTYDGIDLSGERAVTAVVDNGEGHNADPDQISLSFFSPIFPIGDCSDYTLDQFPLFDISCGQVQVK